MLIWISLLTTNLPSSIMSTYAAWNVRAAMESEHLNFARRGSKFLE
ncbi:MAG TPA: hypothetical protein VFR68_03615 [Candidatus Dormibacteraeota bacterium]|nr:hypothetical protein [Candidatus Dormibacteraeota bacterium]